MKIIANVPTLGIEITSNNCWIDTNQTPIDQMTNDHLRNAILWAYRRWKDEEGAKLVPEKAKGYTYREWYLILKAVYDQRIQKQIECAKSILNVF